MATYNAQIIQAGFGIVFLLIIVYVYRLFFMVQTSEPTSVGGHSDVLEEKLNLILDQQRQRVAAPTSETQQSEQVARGNEAEIDRLKAEIYNLHQQVKEFENNGPAQVQAQYQVQVQPATASTASGPSAVADFPGGTNAKVQLETKVKDLESRLSEYEIIADDIAELSQLRTDNAKLLQEIIDLKSGSNGNQSVDKIPGPTLIEKSDEATAQTSEIVPMAAAETRTPQQVIDDLINSVNEQDQNLISDFEKAVLKKDKE